MTFSGDLKGIGLADVFQNLAGNRAVGTLRVCSRATERFVRFEDGAVAAFSLGVGKGLPILEHLRDRGWVDERTLEKVVQKRKRSRKPLHRLLVEIGALSEEDATDAIAELVAEHCYELMSVKEAEFAFEEGDPPARVFGGDQRAVGLRLDVGPLLVEGARRGDEWTRISKVVTSDRDVFVLLEGWDELELDELAFEVGPLLDGRTDVRTVRDQLFASKFAVLKTISDLVHQGGARPATAEEVDTLAREALEAGDDEEAVRLLTHAVGLERSNRELRRELGDVLVRLGRAKDAAAEYAQMGYQAAQEGDLDEALELYAVAVELNPEDLPLRERRLELVRKTGDTDATLSAALALADLQLDMGLAERARAMLEGLLGDRELARRDDLHERLARVEAALGHWQEASRVWQRLADRVMADDETKAVEYLRHALEQDPEDEALAGRVRDIESGLLKRRAARRRGIATLAAAIALLVSLGYAVVAELIAARRTSSAVELALGDLESGEGIDAAVALAAVGEDWGWTPSGRRCRELADRVVDLQLRAIESMRAHGAAPTRALGLLERLAERIDRADLRSTCATLTESVEREQRAAAVVRRVERGEALPAADELALLESLTDVGHVPFLQRELARVTHASVRHALLTAAAAVPDPRLVALAGRLHLLHGIDDPAVEAVLVAGVRDGAVEDDEVQAVVARARQAMDRPRERVRARELLGWLGVTAADPGAAPAPTDR